MGHIEDRWQRPKRGQDGKVLRDGRGRVVLERTERYGKGDRYRVRYIAPDGRERSRSFPDKQKGRAEDFLVTTESDKLRGTYVDPAAGKVLFREFAQRWMVSQTWDPSTRETTESRVRKHLYPFFGDRELAWIKPGRVREWNASTVGKLEDSTRSVLFSHLRAVLGAAVDDELITKNPCSVKSVKQPQPAERRIVPWEYNRVSAIRDELPERYRLIVDLAAGCGLRQGEAFGLAVGDLDESDGGWLVVQRQVKRVRSRLVFGLPKNDRSRRVPVPAAVGAAFKQHVDAFPPVDITLPWEDPDSDKMVTARLVLTTGRHTALNRTMFNSKIWHPALAAVGVVRSRATGLHALRHFYASTLLDGGENIKALSIYLGHHDPGFTLRTYTHLMPSSADRTRRAIDSVFQPAA